METFLSFSWILCETISHPAWQYVLVFFCQNYRLTRNSRNTQNFASLLFCQQKQKQIPVLHSKPYNPCNRVDKNLIRESLRRLRGAFHSARILCVCVWNIISRKDAKDAKRYVLLFFCQESCTQNWKSLSELVRGKQHTEWHRFLLHRYSFDRRTYFVFTQNSRNDTE